MWLRLPRSCTYFSQQARYQPMGLCHKGVPTGKCLVCSHLHRSGWPKRQTPVRAGKTLPRFPPPPPPPAQPEGEVR